MRTPAIILICALILLPAISVSANQFQDAIDAYSRRDYTKAFRLFEPLAEQGDSEAQYKLGYMLLNGQGVQKDIGAAAPWLVKAADQGHAKAEEIRKSIVAGAFYRLGKEAYLERKDYNAAFNLFHEAADLGNAAAQFRLGVMYYDGEGVPQDYLQAAKWYLKAAEQGQDSAQRLLGILYALGQGVPKDYVSAYMWINLSCSLSESNVDRDSCSELRDRTAERMIPSQIAEAQKLSREWFDKFQKQKE